MPSKKGIKEAADLLMGLPKDERDKVMADMIEKNPALTELIKDKLVTIDDLQFATVKMLQELLKEISINDLGMSLRLSCKEAQENILTNVSTSIREEISEILTGAPQPKVKVMEAHGRIMDIVVAKIERGELILHAGGEKLV